MSRWQSVRTRTLAASVAALCVIAQLLPIVHIVLVRHARCAVHGEVIHVSDGADHSSPDHAAPAAPSSHGAATIAHAASDHAEDAHDTCRFVGDRRDAVLATPPALAALPAYAPAATIAPAAAARLPQVALYRLAPKLSPPRHTA